MPLRIEEPTVILTARVPKSLQRALKVHCMESNVEVRGFIARAIEERLVKVTGRARTGPRKR